MDTRKVGEGTGEHDTFQDSQEQAWAVGKQWQVVWRGGQRGQESLKEELESGVGGGFGPGRGGGTLRRPV